MTEPGSFFVAVLALLLTPGPTNTLVAVAGAVKERCPAPILLAELAGYLSSIVLLRLVVLPLLPESPTVMASIRFLLVIYLLYTAIRLWASTTSSNFSRANVRPRLVFLTTLLNPKSLIFAVAIIPHDHPFLLAYFAAFAAIVLACGYAWFLLGRFAGANLDEHSAFIQRVASIALVAFASLLAVSTLRYLR